MKRGVVVVEEVWEEDIGVSPDALHDPMSLLIVALGSRAALRVSRRPIAPRSPLVPRPKSQMQMELPDPIKNFIRPTPGGEEEEGQSAALAAGAARDGVSQSPPATPDSIVWPQPMGAQ